jgi:hypothetical protein
MLERQVQMDLRVQQVMMVQKAQQDHKVSRAFKESLDY